MASCSDCGLELQQIYIIDNHGRQAYQVGFDFTIEPPRKGMISSEMTGSVHAFRCPQCSKVSFYAYEGMSSHRV